MKFKNNRDQLNNKIVEVAERKLYAIDQSNHYRRRFEQKKNWGFFAFWLWGEERWLLEYHHIRSRDVAMFLNEYHEELLLQLRNLNEK